MAIRHTLMKIAPFYPSSNLCHTNSEKASRPLSLEEGHTVNEKVEMLQAEASCTCQAMEEYLRPLL